MFACLGPILNDAVGRNSYAIEQRMRSDDDYDGKLSRRESTYLEYISNPSLLQKCRANGLQYSLTGLRFSLAEYVSSTIKAQS